VSIVWEIVAWEIRNCLGFWYSDLV